MALKLTDIDLPIIEVIPEICRHLTTESRLIIHAPPGAGKSTIVPLALLNEPWLNGKKIVMLEPRRLAAKSIALRMADLLGEQVGRRVGYRIRFENKISKETEIEVVTEGILTRMLQHDSSIEGIGAIIFDEFHERSLFADTALALSLESQSILRPDLKLVIMSATLDIPELQETLGATLVESLGRQYPIETTYIDRHEIGSISQNVAQTVVETINNYPNGDILAFLPGEGEIKRCLEILNRRAGNCSVLPLYGQLSHREQQRALRSAPNGERKVVLATAIAETSLTIEGVSIVIDCGFERSVSFDTRSGLSRLTTKDITVDTANQRSGRAGRLGPGHSIRMWTRGKHHQLSEHRRPEIVEADITSLILDLAAWGTTDPSELFWVTPPPLGEVTKAKRTLTSLKAIDSREAITPYGRELHKISCHPRIANMLLVAKRHKCESLACDIAAIIEERDPLPREVGTDINIRIDALRRERKRGNLSPIMQRVERVARQYRGLLNTTPTDEFVSPFETGLLLTSAFPERVAKARDGNGGEFQMANGVSVKIKFGDDLEEMQWLAIAELNMQQKGGRIQLASPINPKDLLSIATELRVIEWNTKQNELTEDIQFRIGSIILQRRSLKDTTAEERAKAICNAIEKNGAHMLDFDKSAIQWQNRILSLSIWEENSEWPDVSTPHLIATVSEWLTPYLAKIKRGSDLKKLPLAEILSSTLLSWDQKQRLDSIVPERIEVPSGSHIRLEYQANGSAPVLAARIQELFGLTETPSVNRGKVSVLMHLLSPGYKPLQITADLNNFWNKTYFEVKKEGKRRYPKHAWPDNPMETQPLKGRPKR